MLYFPSFKIFLFPFVNIYLVNCKSLGNETFINKLFLNVIRVANCTYLSPMLCKSVKEEYSALLKTMMNIEQSFQDSK
jgi:hypothetical protein